MLSRYLLCGFIGVVIEVGFTAISKFIRKKDVKMKGKTYLWMIPIYFIGGVCLNRLTEYSENHSMVVRMNIYGLANIGIEYLSGLVLHKIIGICPWHYRSKYSIHGYVRLDYYPFWVLLGLLFEIMFKKYNLQIIYN